jgi:hypothetical protein
VADGALTTAARLLGHSDTHPDEETGDLDHCRESTETGLADSELDALRSEGAAADRWRVLEWMEQVASPGGVGPPTA